MTCMTPHGTTRRVRVRLFVGARRNIYLITHLEVMLLFQLGTALPIIHGLLDLALKIKTHIGAHGGCVCAIYILHHSMYDAPVY